MRINREELLRVLESVGPGLANREILEQSSCLVFSNGEVITFNDEICCRRKSPLKIEGAVKAKPLLDLLSKLPEDDIDVEQAEGELIVKGKKRKAGIRMEADVLLPVESVDRPEDWRKLPPEFEEAVSVVHSCASTEESQFVLTCVHIAPNHLEACDRFQVARYEMKTGVDRSLLVRADSLRRILGFNMTEVCETSSWIHFRNPAGLVVACRRYLDEYMSLDKFLVADGMEPMTLPGGLDELVDRAEIFSSENAAGNHVVVELSADRAMIQGEGASGWYKEMKQTKYAGKPVRFLIAPKLLVDLASKGNECGVDGKRLLVDSGKFRYVTSTSLPETKKKEDVESD